MTRDGANRLLVRKYLLTGEQPQDGPVLTKRVFPQRTLVIARDFGGRVLWAFFIMGAEGNLRLHGIDEAYLIVAENMEAKAEA